MTRYLGGLPPLKEFFVGTETSILKLDLKCTVHFLHGEVVHISFIKRIWLDSGLGPFLFWAVSGVVSLLLSVVACDMIEVFLGFPIWAVIVVRSIVSVSLESTIVFMMLVVASPTMVVSKFVTMVPIMNKMLFE